MRHLARTDSLRDAVAWPGGRYGPLPRSPLLLPPTGAAGLRRTGALDAQPCTLATSGYDPASRLSGVTNGNVNAAYNYLANSPLVGQIISRQNGTTRMTTTKSYDNLNRLTSIQSATGISPPFSFTYQYNNANQRTKATLGPDGSYWAYSYDSLGQVTSGKKYWYDGVPFAGQQFEYTFDDTCPVRYSNHVLLRICAAQLCRRLLLRGVYWRSEKANAGACCRGRTLDAESAAPGTCVLRGKPEPSGCDPPRAIPQERLGQALPEEPLEALSHGVNNRKRTKAGGDGSGQNLRVSWYTNTPLNQITNRTVPGSNDVIGIAHASAAVTVNGQTPYRRGEYYRKEVALTNATAVACQAVTNRAVLAGVTNTQTGNLLAPPRTQPFWYDQDGNLLSDGVWTNTWDAENRLVAAETTGPVPTAAKAKEAWTYYGDGRWAQRVIYSWNGGAWVPQTTNRFIWDGKVIAAIVDQTNGLVQAFVRGLDLSGSVQGAGGAGGVLALITATNGSHFYAFDGNGNVAALVSATNGAETARYDYGPFAEPVRVTGPMASANPMRFSSQFTDDVAGDVRYLYRDYNPSTGRWKSRDPIEERADPNIYAMMGNDPVDWIDLHGLVRPDCGTFILLGDSDGSFRVDFTPIKCGCKKDRIRLVQAAKATTDPPTHSHGWRFDIIYPTVPTTNDPIYQHTHTRGGIPFPSYRSGTTSGNYYGVYGYKDAPYFEGYGATWDFEVCAVCDFDREHHDLVRGCFTFSLNWRLHEGYTFAVPNGTAHGGSSYEAGCSEPTSGWNAAVTAWQSLAGSQVR